MFLLKITEHCQVPQKSIFLSPVRIFSFHLYDLVWCQGMEYLESRSLVHRDLAARYLTNMYIYTDNIWKKTKVYLKTTFRNVLLDRGFQAKVADFGLTFDRLDEKEDEGKPIIAVYWSAPEAIGKRWEHYGAVQCLCNCRYISLLFIIIIIIST